MMSDGVEAEVLRRLASHANFEAAMLNASTGSMLAQKAACLEWLACGAEYQRMLAGGPEASLSKLVEAQKNMVEQLRSLVQ